LRVGSELSEDGIENSIVRNCMFVIEVVVFGGFFVNVELFHCVQVETIFSGSGGFALRRVFDRMCVDCQVCGARTWTCYC
jgi:hypothetical protein